MIIRQLEATGLPKSSALGLFGIPGLTAYLGLMEIGKPKVILNLILPLISLGWWKVVDNHWNNHCCQWSFTGRWNYRYQFCRRPDGSPRWTDCKVFLSNEYFFGGITQICHRILGLRVLGYTGEGDKASWIKTELVSGVFPWLSLR